MERGYSVEGSLSCEFSSIYIVRELWPSLKSEVVRDVIEKRAFWKKRPLRGDFENFVPKRFTVSRIHVLCANFVKLVKSCVSYRKKRTKFRPDLSLSLLRGSRPKSARASGKQCTHSIPNFIKIGLLPAEL